MKTSEKFEFEYNEKGNIKSKSYEIKFVSQRIIDDFNTMMENSNIVRKNYDKIQDILVEIEELKKEKLENYKELVTKKQNEHKELLNTINEIGSVDFFHRRFELIKSILIDNGYEGDKDVIDFDFWYNKVDPTVLISSLARLIYKDIIAYNKGKTAKK